MATPQAAVAMVGGAVMTAISFFVPNVRCLLSIVSCLMGLAGAVMVHVLDIEANRDASLAGVYLMGFYNVPWVFMLSLQSSNAGGATKKSFMAISIACIYGRYRMSPFLRYTTKLTMSFRILAIGNIIGPQLFLSSQAPTYPLGIGAMIFSFTLMGASTIFYFFLAILENKRRDSLYGKPEDSVQSGLEAERDDKTDKENNAFRYTY